MDEKTRIGIANAIQTLAQVDRILDGISEPARSDDSLLPWKTAHVWIFRAMCLLIDFLEGIEDTSFSSKEHAPVAKTREPYAYLAKRYAARADRCRNLARGHAT